MSVLGLEQLQKTKTNHLNPKRSLALCLGRELDLWTPGPPVQEEGLEDPTQPSQGYRQTRPPKSEDSIPLPPLDLTGDPVDLDTGVSPPTVNLLKVNNTMVASTSLP